MWHSPQSSDGYLFCISFTQSFISFFEVSFISFTSMAFRKKNGFGDEFTVGDRIFETLLSMGVHLWLNKFTIPSLRKQPFLLALCRCGRFARSMRRAAKRNGSFRSLYHTQKQKSKIRSKDG